MFVILGLAAALVLALTPAAGLQAGVFPPVIDLPDGHLPEGIAVGPGAVFYAGSRANGSVYRGSLLTGEGSILVPGAAGRVLTGLYVDERYNYLFASGAGGGTGYIFDTRTGATLAAYQLAEGTPTFVNDVVVARDAAYFTDSQRPFIYKVPLGIQGELPDQSAVERIPLGGDFVFVPGFNANGIEATPNGEWLFVVHSSRGELYRVDPQTGDATLVDLGGASLTNGDGIRRQGDILYVVRNRLNQIDVLELDDEWDSAVVLGTLTDSDFDVPTTVGLFGSALYAVNARFTTPPTPTTPYTVVRVSRQP
jgi:sugar lactone lactonase YvrE